MIYRNISHLFFSDIYYEVIIMFGKAQKKYQEMKKTTIKKSIKDDDYLIDGARIFSNDPYNFVRLTNFKTDFKINNEDMTEILNEVKNEKEEEIEIEKLNRRRK